jgi:moderate conductance mechanosensitive channel
MLRSILLLACLCIALPTPWPAAWAQSGAAQAPLPAAPAATQAPGMPLRVIIEVPNDAAGRAYVQDRLAPAFATTPAAAQLPATAQPAQTSPAPAATATSNPAALAPDPGAEMSSMATQGIVSTRARAAALLAAAPAVPRQVMEAIQHFGAENADVDLFGLIVAFAIFALGGYAARRAAWWSARGLLNKILESRGDTVRQRLRIHAMRVSISIYVLMAWLLGSLGAFLLFPWPPLFREIIIVMLAAYVVHGLALSLGRVIIAPGARMPYFRVLPISTPLAWFWFRWFIGIVDAVAISWAIVTLLRIVGLPLIAREVVGSLCLLGLAAGLIVLVWKRQLFPGEEAPSRVSSVLLTAAIVLAWLLGVMHLRPLFWTLAVAVVLPMAMSLCIDAVRHVVRGGDATADNDPRILAWAVVVERALRALLIIGGASLLADAWGVDLVDIAMGETLVTRIVRACIRVVTVLLIADLIWRLTRALIDGRLDGPPADVHDDTPEGRKRQRLRTLLPILRNFIFVMLLTVTLLMTLDALGIQIGPLLAGAGVVGIAVGFGAQTLVKDIISGIFYLLDDAFRVGEYIQTKSHKGTVESFSLRSVKLRHHRGPLTTVPFGELGAVQNLSRDWVIDKITIGVPYDTDLDKAKRIVKEIGRELLTDPELGQNILEPLKMQGVEQMGDYAIQLRLKMMTKPGEQFMIRRRAYGLLKKRFDENGIRFAMPTVSVTGGGADIGAVAARQLYDATRPQPQATEVPG